MWTTEIEDCLSQLTKEEKKVLKRTITNGGFGDDSCRFRNILGDISKEETRCQVYLTNYKYPFSRRFYYKKTEWIFKSIRAKLCPIDDIGQFFVYQKEWVKRIEHDKNNDVDYVIDTYMFGVIENDRERKSRDFHVSFYYRG